MGLLRFMLSFAVVIAHTGPVFGFKSIGSDAVPAFFVISGFYMHLTLTSQYGRPNGVSDFYRNRFLRIAPMYWAVLFVAFCASLVVVDAGSFADRISVSAANAFHRATSDDVGALAAAVPNLAIVGSDIVRLFCRSDTTGRLVLQYLALNPDCQDMSGYLILPQTWSLSVEIIFYALSPWLCRLRTVWFLPLVLACICLRHQQSSSELYWKQLVFSYNAGYLALGMLACRAYRQNGPTFHRLRFILSPFPFVVWAFLPEMMRGVSPLDEWFIWTAYAFSLPCLFSLSASSRVDRAVAELSYPVYLVHWLFAWPATLYGPLSAFIAMGWSVLTSIVLIVVVEAPLRRTRQKLRSGAGATRHGRYFTPSQQSVPVEATAEVSPNRSLSLLS